MKPYWTEMLYCGILQVDVEMKNGLSGKVLYKTYPKGTIVRVRGMDDKDNLMLEKDEWWQWVEPKSIRELPLPPAPPMLTKPAGPPSPW